MITLEEVRQEWDPSLPEELIDQAFLSCLSVNEVNVSNEVGALFPYLKERELLSFRRNEGIQSRPFSVGVLFSGGPAAGGHNVVISLYETLQKFHPDSTLIGFLNGPSGLIEGSYRNLENKELKEYRNQGGFDLLGTGRTKIEKPEQFEACFKTIEKLKLDAVVIIGGDDSNTNAAYLANFLKEKGSNAVVVGVPKTIDGDLKNRFVEISFGFDSAAKTYAELVGNVCRDAKSQDKYYFFIKLMGRTASHLVLETALHTHPNLTLISEEVAKEKMTLKQLVKKISDAIVLREKKGLHHGVILIPEGIIEFIEDMKGLVKALSANPDPSKLSTDLMQLWNLLPKSTQDQLQLDRDPHGNVQVSKIETERLFIQLVAQDLKERNDYKGSFSPQPLFYGYEGRSCLPSNFDASYCYALGIVAALLIRSGKTGYMALIQNLARPTPEWVPYAAPLIAMMQLVEKKGVVKAVIEKGLVDLEDVSYKKLKEMEQANLEGDRYRMAGPIQFFGEEEIANGPLGLL